MRSNAGTELNRTTPENKPNRPAEPEIRPAKPEIRNSKSEIRRKSESRNGETDQLLSARIGADSCNSCRSGIIRVYPCPSVVEYLLAPNALPTSHCAYHEKRLGAVKDLLRQREARRLIRQVLFASEEAHERPALERNKNHGAPSAPPRRDCR